MSEQKGVPSALVSAGGLQVVGDKFGMGMDDTHMKLRGAPVLDEPALSSHQKMIADKLTVSELMTIAMIALPPVVKVRGRPSPAHHLHAHSHTPTATDKGRGQQMGTMRAVLRCLLCF